jgi:hypothetical protein
MLHSVSIGLHLSTTRRQRTGGLSRAAGCRANRTAAAKPACVPPIVSIHQGTRGGSQAHAGGVLSNSIFPPSSTTSAASRHPGDGRPFALNDFAEPTPWLLMSGT